MRNVLIVLSGPSGVGKGTVAKRLVEKNKDLALSISYTTRAPRKGEENGKDYFFTTREDFDNKISQNGFLEYSNHFDNFYGTPKAAVDKMLKNGECVVLKIEVEGADNIRRLYPDAISVFIVPPSFEELKFRLKNRGTETEQEYEKRVEIAREELKRAKEYDYIVINDKVSQCADDICGILSAEAHRFELMKGFVNKLIN